MFFRVREIGLIAFLDATSADRQNGHKFQCFHVIPMVNYLFKIWILHNLWIAIFSFLVADCIYQIWRTELEIVS